MSDEGEDTFNNGYETGFDDGYSIAEKATIKLYEEKIDDHERELVKSHREGYEEAEEKYSRELDNVRSNIENIIEHFHTIIKELKNENYVLRKEHATITRSIQKST